MNTSMELYRFSKKYQINYNANEKKGTELFERFLSVYPKVNFNFAFIGFHQYQSFKNHEGMTAYGISGNMLYAVSRKDSYEYNLYRCKSMTGQKKMNGIYLTLEFEKETVVINLGFANGDVVLASLKQSSGKS
ncbi:hypothetical protein [Enterococcus pallens]|uniref:YokE-like PH domain-containing protein n=1 Tax=Enterococcus pallens ATCC BAA-351 TaxID=1158607 RepID=R2PVJ4_9ENTE|nr:hypothetical protein [Enterococcus pallens]EOH88507.1 hypothetical protein UAU_04326 [Enterococcus pallens ATCC BAA-351]EOU17688.1 hypothetical protein I588_02675 [Enterococcus pallens ATCC BAA-351]OJG81564.1 hypothetical protein RV10_GL002803 [Enterococcus pallens]